jgi:hypothetical protein
LSIDPERVDEGPTVSLDVAIMQAIITFAKALGRAVLGR